MTLDINNAGCEFVKSVLKLYRSAKYTREREVIANKMLVSALEAGSLITELGVCPETKEDDVARKALSELSKAMFIVKVMCEDRIYSQKKVQKVIDLSSDIKELIELYFKEEKPAEEAKPQPAPQPAQPLLVERVKLVDKGGFDEIYTGEF